MTDITSPPAVDPAAKVSWTPRQLYVLVLMLLVAVCNYMDRGLLAILQEPMKVELGLTDSQLGLMGGAAFGLFFSICGIPMARLAERMNRANLLGVGIAFWSLMTAACGVAGTFGHLLLARMGVGAGEGGSIPISQSVLADTFSVRQRGVVMSAAAAAAPIANIISPLIVPVIVAAYGWRAGFIGVGLPGLLLALLVVLTLKEPRDLKAKSATPAASRKGMKVFFTDMGWLLKNGPFMFLFLAGGAIGIGVTAVSLFKISYLTRVQGYSLKEAGAIWSIAALCGLAGTFAGGFVSDKFADSRGRSYVLTPAVTSILTFIAYAVAFTATSAPLAAGALMVAQFTYNMKNGPIYAAVQNIVPAHLRATGAAMHMLAATSIGIMVGPTFVGFMSDTLAASAFGTDLSAYFAACPGGKAAVGAAVQVATACKTASATGLREALLGNSSIFLVASFFLVLASRKIRIEAPD